MILIEILAALALAAAGGLRLSLTLFCLAIAGNHLLPTHPLAELFHHPVVLILLGGWTLVEAVACRTALGYRVVQALQFFLAPVAGGLIGATFAPQVGFVDTLALALAGAAGAAILQAVWTGMFFRLGRMPHHLLTLQEGLLAGLVLLTCNLPSLAGPVVLALLGLALYQSYRWRRQFNRPGSLCPS